MVILLCSNPCHVLNPVKVHRGAQTLPQKKKRGTNVINKGILLCKQVLLAAGHWEGIASDALVGMLVEVVLEAMGQLYSAELLRVS